MELRITATQLDTVREELIQNDGLERFAFLYCTRQDETLLVEDVDVIEDDETSIQHRTGIELSLDGELDRLNDCLERGQVPLLVHSHPFAELAGFSGQDYQVFERYHDWLGPLYPDQALGFMVVGRSSVDTTIFERLGAETRDDLAVEVIGDWKAEHEMTVPQSGDDTPDIDTDRYDRAVRALGEAGQAKLADTKVAVVGLGGLGSMAVEQLARLGIREFVLIDPDVVEESNLPRIYGATDAHIDRPKVEVVKQHLWRVNPNVEIETHHARVQEVADRVLPDCDVIVGAVDRVNARSFLNEFAVKHLQYYLDAGVVIKTDDEADGEQITEELGIVQTVIPGVNGCLSCLGRHDPERARLERLSEAQIREEIDRGYIEGDILTPQPAVTPLNGVIASQVSRILAKLVTGYTEPPDMIQYRGLGDEVVPITTHHSSECLVCGDRGVIGQGNRQPNIELSGSDKFGDPTSIPEPTTASDQGADEAVDPPAATTAVTDEPDERSSTTKPAEDEEPSPAIVPVESTESTWTTSGDDESEAEVQTRTKPEDTDSGRRSEASEKTTTRSGFLWWWN